MLNTLIPSYAYEEYNDDQDIQAFITAFNTLAQEYVNWFNQIGLPIYTGTLIVGALLDWVAQGLYGIVRPSLPGAGQTRIFGPLNTVAFNTLPLNGRQVKSSSTYYQTNDDIFKRVITWNFYKGDGQVFNIRWLKRRVLRFLLGTNGTDPGISQTNQISVTFGLNNQVNINIRQNNDSLQSGAMFNRFGFNRSTFNAYKVSTVGLTPLPSAQILASAIQSGALQLPFQFTYVVNVI
ncbi:hypothetical protein AB4Y43_01445 [Paraburkholderia sp. BR10872]|uniref:hypothetical protein n=1 Tax=Paraburkholderia sp. BR10872 TaxID=3236989 RepID=UPI0034D31A07